jgi:small subunit ribosomal protein S17
MSEDAKKPRTLVGQVVSIAMDKTIAVRIDRQVEHPLYRKYVRKSTKLLAHDERNECSQGDTVAIEECRPLSKRKSWRLQRVLERATQI